MLSEQPQARYADYNIDYQMGTIFFKQPIPSHGEGFNPLFIVVEYEADDNDGQEALRRRPRRGEAASTTTSRSAPRCCTRAPSAATRACTAATCASTSTTRRASAASTRSTHVDAARSRTRTARATRGSRSSPAATRDLDTRAYYREQRAGFGARPAVRERDCDAQDGPRRALHARLRLAARAARRSARATSRRARARDVFEGRVENHTGPGRGYGGFRWAHDQLSDGTDATAPQVLGGASYTTSGTG